MMKRRLPKGRGRLAGTNILLGSTLSLFALDFRAVVALTFAFICHVLFLPGAFCDPLSGGA